ncbi:hypothetical protein JB92DRAFT_3200405 [Gautieria morchelliformis]|nr:hypothetical protein JB92DRAFT_3200405 [Gautieria morchelliformis]
MHKRWSAKRRGAHAAVPLPFTAAVPFTAAATLPLPFAAAAAGPLPSAATAAATAPLPFAAAAAAPLPFTTGSFSLSALLRTLSQWNLRSNLQLCLLSNLPRGLYSCQLM